MRKNTSQNNKRQEKNPGWFPVLNNIFALDISKHALLVLFYLMRLANPKKGNSCFPSIKTIAKNCKIPSSTTVAKALEELRDAELITQSKFGRVNLYKINSVVYLGIDRANKKDNQISKLEATSPPSGDIENEERQFLPISPLYDTTSPPSGHY